ncbi:MAG: hypothetical protein Q4F38_07890, partial [Akkermansia sp.]|nr:hypothetical protein [Akkermansia sp.]
MSTNNDTPANGSGSAVNAADVTNITPANAAALASANLNSGTDCATTNTNTVMNTTSHTTAGALASEGVSPDTTLTPVFPDGVNRATYATPQKPGGNWDLVYACVCVDQPH